MVAVTLLISSKLLLQDPEKFPGDSTKAENAKHMGTAMSYIIVSCWIVSGIVMSGELSLN